MPKCIGFEVVKNFMCNYEDKNFQKVFENTISLMSEESQKKIKQYIEEEDYDAAYRLIGPFRYHITKFIYNISNSDVEFREDAISVYLKKTMEVPKQFLKYPRPPYYNTSYSFDKIEADIEPSKSMYQVITVSQKTTGQSAESPHQVLIFVNTKNKTMEYFDSVGPTAEWYEPLETAIKNYLLKIYPDYKYISMLDYCPKSGPQKYDSLKYCAVYSKFYAFLRLNCPEMSRKEIIQAIKSEELSYRPVKKYLCYMWQVGIKYGIIDNLILYKRTGDEDYYKKVEDIVRNARMIV